MTQPRSCARCINQERGIVAFGSLSAPTAPGGTTRSRLPLVGKRSGSGGQTHRSLNTLLVWRFHRVWRERLAALDGPDAGGKVEEGGGEASLAPTGAVNGAETGRGATRQIHLKPRPTQAAIGSLEAERAGLGERARRS